MKRNKKHLKEIMMNFTSEQAMKIAVMMLQAAEYYTSWIVIHPIEVPRKMNYEANIRLIADALIQLTGESKQDIYEQLIESKSKKSIELWLSPKKVNRLKAKYHICSTYKDSKGRIYTLYNGVYQVCDKDYAQYNAIPVRTFVEFVEIDIKRNPEKFLKKIRSLQEKHSRQINMEIEQEYFGVIYV